MNDKQKNNSTSDTNPTPKPVVTYRQIDKAFNKNHEAVMSKAQAEAEKATKDPVEAAMMLMSLGNALSILEAEAVGHKDAGVMMSPQHREASLLQSFLAEESAKIGKLEPLPAGGEEAKFDNHDLLGWFGSFFSFLKGLKPHKWQIADDTPESFPNNSNSMRVAMFSDWGTGLYGAPVIASSVQNDADGYQMLFHLGDVYYSGDKNEIQDRFLNYFPTNAGAVRRALNSNHEMYTGGKSYFNLTLKQFGQKASYFAMQNDKWILVGLDSAYSDPDWRYDKAQLHKSQLPWLNNLVNNAGGRKIILFTHHQPFSWSGVQEGKMNSQLGELLASKKIFAWYWGHEHSCILYDQHPAWGLHGRCLGNGGFPSFREKLNGAPIELQAQQNAAWHRMQAKALAPSGLILDAPNPHIVGEENKYGAHGYITLEFADNHLNEIVHLADGTRIYERQLT